MKKIAIIIPSRLDAKRLPDKPLKLINKKEMILHVYDIAINSKVGDVYVATPDKKIIDVVKKYGGNAFLTNNKHQTGTDRIFQVFKDNLNKEPEIIINLQGDMPNLDFKHIKNLAEYMNKNLCEIGTLASDLNIDEEKNDPNICKVVSDQNIVKNGFSDALDFYRLSEKFNHFTYHHIGIYAFTKEALIRYVSLKRSKLEIKRKLEQLRALENGIKIKVGYIKDFPLSVDTEEDLIKIKKIMEKNEKN